MTWIQRYRIRNYLRSSMWIVPLAMGVLGWLFHKMVREFDLWTRWGWLDYTPDGARGIVGAITSSMLTFIVFFLSILFLAVQLAATQLTPRVITDVFTRPVGKISLGIFVFTYTFSVALQGRSVDPVPQLALFLVIVFSVACIGVFLFLIGYMANSLQPISIVTRVAAEGTAAIETIYSARLTGSEDTEADDPFFQGAKPPATIPYRGKPGVFLAFDAQGLAEVARRNGCVIRVVPQVGRFVSAGDPLFHVYGWSEALRERELQESVAVGPERTIEQDPTFAFRIIVDIAIRALSPAVNDPTTAVQCIDQVHRLLPIVGRKDLGDGRIRGQEGHLRLVFPTPDWEDYILLGVSEIRTYGAGSLQVMRRLRGMLENLIEVLPPQRIPPLQDQLRQLECVAERSFADPEERRLAGIGDYQGLGGARLRHARKRGTREGNRKSAT